MPEGDAATSEPENAGQLPAGTVLGDYEIVRSVGAGGMAVVYEARHRTLGKRVALKVLHASQGGIKPDLAKRFVREAENSARLNHRHVVDVTNVGVANGMPYLVMEFLEGEDLGKYLEREGKLSLEATADLLVPVVCAIGAAHDAGIVHRDLKPQNIFLCKTRNSEELVPMVVDFGISKLVDGSSLELTGTNAILGTPFYMSPEQAMEAKNVDGHTDQFSLGVILYECVTGHRPFEGESLFTVLTAIVNLDHPPPSGLTYPMDPRFEALVDRALKKVPAARFESMQELGRELLKFASLRVQVGYAAELRASLPAAVLRQAKRLSEVPKAPYVSPRARANLGARQRWFGVGMALALVSGLFAWWALSRSGDQQEPALKAEPSVPQPPARKTEPAVARESSDWADTPDPGRPVLQVQPVEQPKPQDVVAVEPSTPPALKPPESAGGVRMGGGPTKPARSEHATGTPPTPATGASKPERGANRALILQ